MKRHLSLLAISALVCSCNPVVEFYSLVGWEEDNVLEEVLEYAIEEATDLSIDLTPSSPEDAH